MSRRIEPLPITQWPAAMRDAMAALAPPEPRHPRPVQERRPKAMNTLGTFAHHPALARAFMTFNGHVLLATTLSERQREILILRVATLRRSSYEWAQHVFMARDAGLSDEEIARIAWGPGLPFWSEVEGGLLLATDELINDGGITDATYRLLAQHLDTAQILDVIFTVGAYETLALMFRSCGLDVDDDIHELLRRSATSSQP